MDVGGTKVEVAALNATGDYLARLRVATPHDYDGAIRAISALLARAEAEAGGTGTVGVGCPGQSTRAMVGRATPMPCF